MAPPFAGRILSGHPHSRPAQRSGLGGSPVRLATPLLRTHLWSRKCNHFLFKLNSRGKSVCFSAKRWVPLVPTFPCPRTRPRRAARLSHGRGVKLPAVGCVPVAGHHRAVRRGGGRSAKAPANAPPHARWRHRWPSQPWRTPVRRRSRTTLDARASPGDGRRGAPLCAQPHADHHGRDRQAARCCKAQGARPRGRWAAEESACARPSARRQQRNEQLSCARLGPHRARAGVCLARVGLRACAKCRRCSCAAAGGRGDGRACQRAFNAGSTTSGTADSMDLSAGDAAAQGLSCPAQRGRCDRPRHRNGRAGVERAAAAARSVSSHAGGLGSSVASAKAAKRGMGCRLRASSRRLSAWRSAPPCSSHALSSSCTRAPVSMLADSHMVQQVRTVSRYSSRRMWLRSKYEVCCDEVAAVRS